MRIEQITNAKGKERPRCEHRIKRNWWGTHRRRAEGIPEDKCGKPSYYRVDDTPMCETHAGKEALNHMIGAE